MVKFHHLSDHNEEEETEEDENPNEMDNVPEIFKIEGNLFYFETPLCEAFHEFNWLLKIDTDLFTYDIQNFKTYDEYKQELNNDKAKETKWPTCTSDIDGFCNGGELPRMVRVGRLTYFQDPCGRDVLADRKLKDETLALKADLKTSTSTRNMKLLVNYKSVGGKVHAHESLYYLVRKILDVDHNANMKTEWASNPYLDVNRIFERDYEASNVSCTQENQGHKGDPIPEPSN
ncbi:hypothetical protein Tco_0190320 [Tanacetum coccineum]